MNPEVNWQSWTGLAALILTTVLGYLQWASTAKKVGSQSNLDTAQASQVLVNTSLVTLDSFKKLMDALLKEEKETSHKQIQELEARVSQLEAELSEARVTIQILQVQLESTKQ